jgi:hypothetical protein
MKLRIEIGFDSTTTALIARLIKALEKTTPPEQVYKLVGGSFVRRIAEDRPADTFAFRKAVVVDSEGNPVDPQPDLNYTFSSDKEGITQIAGNGDGTVTTSYGTAVKTDGAYEIATLKAESNEISLPDGSTIKDVITEQIQLVPGGAAGFGTTGGFDFPPDA